MNYTYILLCCDGTYYTGWTNDLEKRFQAHVSGHGAKYTKAHKPVKIAYYETFDTPEEAMSREWHIKKMSREEKIELIEGMDQKK
ncbi:MAG: GIY-YIG nuclease family protein [Solobacterium sp.]|jgi:putative endonuclease|nr:GIY-YIG nuclease family protein [Solobacterium sp.]MCH4205235.1 GIY-YIG nuclease family protein [Solobacterium sp.]MCH4226828.1 GIY-YIG nuclease family protein [Solobacterium sp.]MCH4281588.1 GIY-YIG nuclease family protein [Solobacterium sp.]